jgi:hypothetical protein
MAADAMSAYRIRMFRVVAASMLLAGSIALADEPVPLYTNDDLDKMFGPPPAQVTEPVDKSTPEDWAWVESYLDRQYARIEADRQYELNKRTLDIAEERTYTRSAYYGGYLGGYASLGLGYPAATWWQNVHRRYVTRGIPSGPGTRRPTGSSSRPSPRSGGRAHAKAP